MVFSMFDLACVKLSYTVSFATGIIIPYATFDTVSHKLSGYSAVIPWCWIGIPESFRKYPSHRSWPKIGCFRRDGNNRTACQTVRIIARACERSYKFEFSCLHGVTSSSRTFHIDWFYYKIKLSWCIFSGKTDLKYYFAETMTQTMTHFNALTVECRGVGFQQIPETSGNFPSQRSGVSVMTAK